jgi:hypothetical protein
MPSSGCESPSALAQLAEARADGLLVDGHAVLPAGTKSMSTLSGWTCPGCATGRVWELRCAERRLGHPPRTPRACNPSEWCGRREHPGKQYTTAPERQGQACCGREADLRCGPDDRVPHPRPRTSVFSPTAATFGMALATRTRVRNACGVQPNSSRRVRASVDRSAPSSSACVRTARSSFQRTSSLLETVGCFSAFRVFERTAAPTSCLRVLYSRPPASEMRIACRQKTPTSGIARLIRCAAPTTLHGDDSRLSGRPMASPRWPARCCC